MECDSFFFLAFSPSLAPKIYPSLSHVDAERKLAPLDTTRHDRHHDHLPVCLRMCLLGCLVAPCLLLLLLLRPVAKQHQHKTKRDPMQANERSHDDFIFIFSRVGLSTTAQSIIQIKQSINQPPLRHSLLSLCPSLPYLTLPCKQTNYLSFSLFLSLSFSLSVTGFFWTFCLLLLMKGDSRAFHSPSHYYCLCTHAHTHSHTTPTFTRAFWLTPHPLFIISLSTAQVLSCTRFATVR